MKTGSPIAVLIWQQMYMLHLRAKSIQNKPDLKSEDYYLCLSSVYDIIITFTTIDDILRGDNLDKMSLKVFV